LVLAYQADDKDIGPQGRALDEGADEEGEGVPAAAEDVETDRLGPPTDALIDLGQGTQSTEVLWAPETVGQLKATQAVTQAVLPDAVRAELLADSAQHGVGEAKDPTILRHLVDGATKTRRARERRRKEKRTKTAAIAATTRAQSGDGSTHNSSEEERCPRQGEEGGRKDVVAWLGERFNQWCSPVVVLWT
jgi:hypothetical protein